ncbi:MAG: PTS sugar transporter subunit IIC [Fusobacteriaceae bacterium]|nr:PTS sugar transporter subunit IIC [Fusobacteriaceae bacterium]
MNEKKKTSEKIIEIVMKFVTLKGVVAVKEGLMFTLPVSLIGSVFLLLAQIPYEPFNNWAVKTLGENWTDPLWQVFGATFKIMAIVACMAIAYIYTKNEKHEPMSASFIALITFLILNSSYILSKDGEKIGGVINKAWTGGQGMVTAIGVGLIVGFVYSWFLSKKITVKMPEGVPQGVANQFTALIPGFVIITGAMIIYTFFKFKLDTTLIEFIFKVLQTPLQGVAGSVMGAIILGALTPFFWWFGVHGAAIVGGVMTPLIQANGLANQAILDKGLELTIANGAYVVTQQFNDNYIQLTGSGITIGLVIAMLVASKSQQSKALGKMSLGPAIFNINEPVIFGMPIVMNPFMLLPFILVPTVVSLATYFAIHTGFLPPFSAVMVPWTTPPIISGFILQGIKGAIWQILIIVFSTAVYFPFFKKQDTINFKEEQEIIATNHKEI